MKHRKRLTVRTENQYTRHLIKRMAVNIADCVRKVFGNISAAIEAVSELHKTFQSLSEYKDAIPYEVVIKTVDQLVTVYKTHEREELADTFAVLLGYKSAFDMVSKTAACGILNVPVRNIGQINMLTFSHLLDNKPGEPNGTESTQQSV